MIDSFRSTTIDRWWITAAFAERSFSFFAEWTVKLFWISFDSFVWIPNETPIVSWLLVWRCSSIPKTSRDELPPTNFDWLLVEFWIFRFGSTYATLALFLRWILPGLCPQKELSDGKEPPCSTRPMEVLHNNTGTFRVVFLDDTRLFTKKSTRKTSAITYALCRDRKVSLAIVIQNVLLNRHPPLIGAFCPGVPWTFL